MQAAGSAVDPLLAFHTSKDMRAISPDLQTREVGSAAKERRKPCIGRSKRRRTLAESIPGLRSQELEELMLDALEHVSDLSSAGRGSGGH
eukprot:764590-Hanusia_phi.AAC.3